MNAIAFGESQSLGSASARAAFVGFGNFARKDLAEWFRTKRFMWTALTAVGMMAFGVTAAKIARAVDPAAEVPLDASTNMYMAGWETFIPIFAVFSTMGMIVSERESRTLAWSLSMPLTRSAVLLSKLVTSIVALSVSVVLLPELAAVVTARAVYGEFPNADAMVCPVAGGVAIALLLILLTLATSVFFRSQRAVVGVALCVGLVIPGVISSLLPAAVAWWPISIDQWIENLGAGKPLQAVTPIVWLASLVVLAAAAKLRFDREEL
jgi:ABC-type transport system involved in multi-copper enzyme maturation permease subunit